MSVYGIIIIIGVFLLFSLVLFFVSRRTKETTAECSPHAMEKHSEKEIQRLEKLRSISLNVPLAEKTRPKNFSEIIGQKDGLLTLEAALCGPNPQHVIIYGPPGVGKTAAARLALEKAKQSKAKVRPFYRKRKWWKSTVQPLVLMSVALPILLWGVFMTPFIREQELMVKLEFPSLRRGR